MGKAAQESFISATGGGGEENLVLQGCLLSLPILHTDKSFLNLRAIICRHCLSGFRVNSCPKAVHDSCLTGLKGERESPSGHEEIFIELRADGSGREHNNGLFEI